MNTEILAEVLIHDFNLPELSIKYSFTIKELLVTLIELNSIKEAAVSLEITDSALENIVRRNLKSYFPYKNIKEHWHTHLLIHFDLQRCGKCKCIKELDDFSVDNSRLHKANLVCRHCDNARAKSYRENNLEQKLEYGRQHYIDNKGYYLYRNATRKARKIQATPAWADLEKIKEIYINRPDNMHVDHIYPLNSDWVCGLHVENNLQYLTKEENLVKSNKNIGQ